LNKIVSDATAAGIHVVVAAGDTAIDSCDSSPGTVPLAITVGATEKTTANSVISTSNNGVCIDIFAPGRDIVAAGAALVNSLSKASGTSQACSHVTGAIALIISKQGNASPASMTNTIINLSTKNILRNANAKPNRFLLVPAP
jgi:subtilisin family serine protease